jgi:hypothetical protein
MEINGIRKTAVLHETESDVVRIEGINQEGKPVYDYFPLAAWGDGKQLAIAAEKIFRIRF